MADANEISHARISSCFMHFEGVTEQLCQVSRQRLKKFIECRHKWAKLDCVQADIAKSSYNKFDDDFVNTYLAENTESSFALKWYHHMRCYKKFCDEEKIRRQERSEEKRAKQITETVPITEDSSMEPIEEPSRKVRRSSQICSSVAAQSKTLPQRNQYVLPECCIICGRDASWFRTDKV